MLGAGRPISQRIFLQLSTLAQPNATWLLLLLAQPQLNLPHSSAKWQAEQPGPDWTPG